MLKPFHQDASKICIAINNVIFWQNNIILSLLLLNVTTFSDDTESGNCDTTYIFIFHIQNVHIQNVYMDKFGWKDVKWRRPRGRAWRHYLLFQSWEASPQLASSFHCHTCSCHVGILFSIQWSKLLRLSTTVQSRTQRNNKRTRDNNRVPSWNCTISCNCCNPFNSPLSGTTRPGWAG